MGALLRRNRLGRPLLGPSMLSASASNMASAAALDSIIMLPEPDRLRRTPAQFQKEVQVDKKRHPGTLL